MNKQNQSTSEPEAQKQTLQLKSITNFKNPVAEAQRSDSGL